MAVPPIVAIEIGTSKVVVLIGELREDGNIMITGIGEHPSAGVRKGEIIDLENAVICVRAALEAAEESGKVEVRQVHLAVSGGHIQSVSNRGEVPVLDKESGITEDDIEQVMEVARALNLPHEREVLHTVCQHFCIDNQEQVIKPEGMTGAKLALNMLIVHGVRNRVDNISRVVHDIPMGVTDIALSGLCSALSVLTYEQKQSGAVVIDLGGGTTDYLVYSGGIPSAAGVIAVGGDHITNDIAHGFNIPVSQAEKLKREYGCAILDLETASQKVSLEAEGGFSSKTINLKSLHTVINARTDELMEMIKQCLEEEGVLQHIGSGVVLTGGGAKLNKVADLAERTFRMPCSVGVPRNVSGVAAVTEGPEYATCSGLVQYGFQTMDDNDLSSPMEWLRNLFTR